MRHTELPAPFALRLLAFVMDEGWAAWALTCYPHPLGVQDPVTCRVVVSLDGPDAESLGMSVLAVAVCWLWLCAGCGGVLAVAVCWLD